jgi:hypothetical protein
MKMELWFQHPKTNNMAMTFPGEKPLYKGKKVLRMIFPMKPEGEGFVDGTDKHFREKVRVDLEDGLLLISEEEYEKWALEAEFVGDYILDYVDDSVHAPLTDEEF